MEQSKAGLNTLKGRAFLLAATSALALSATIAPSLVHADTIGTATTNATVQIVGGNLTMSGSDTSSQFSGGILTGSANVKAGTADAGSITLTDARGTGAGYNVTASAPTLRDASGHTLAGGNLSLSNVAVSPIDPTSGAKPTSQVTKDTAVDSGSIPLINSVADTSNGNGMGSYKISLGNLNFKGTASADTYAQTYSTTITYTLANGPENSGQQP